MRYEILISGSTYECYDTCSFDHVGTCKMFETAVKAAASSSSKRPIVLCLVAVNDLHEHVVMKTRVVSRGVVVAA